MRYADVQYPCDGLYAIFSEEENFLIAHVKLFRCVSSW